MDSHGFNTALGQDPQDGMQDLNNENDEDLFSGMEFINHQDEDEDEHVNSHHQQYGINIDLFGPPSGSTLRVGSDNNGYTTTNVANSSSNDGSAPSMSFSRQGPMQASSQMTTTSGGLSNNQRVAADQGGSFGSTPQDEAKPPNTQQNQPANINSGSDSVSLLRKSEGAAHLPWDSGQASTPMLRGRSNASASSSQGVNVNVMMQQQQQQQKQQQHHQQQQQQQQQQPPPEAGPSRSPIPSFASFSGPPNQPSASQNSAPSAHLGRVDSPTTPSLDIKGKGRASPDGRQGSMLGQSQSSTLGGGAPGMPQAGMAFPQTPLGLAQQFNAPTPSQMTFPHPSLASTSSAPSPRPPSPSKRTSPSRPASLALIPEEELENASKDTKSVEAIQAPSKSTDVPSKVGQPAVPQKPSAPKRSRSKAAQGDQANGQPTKKKGAAANARGSKAPESKATTDVPKTPAATGMSTPTSEQQADTTSSPQHHQQSEVKKQIYFLTVPILLLINTELIKGCMQILELFSQKFPGQEYKIEDRYKELVGRLSSNLGHLAALAGSTNISGNPPQPILEPPSMASDALKMLYNQLRTYFMMGQTKAGPPTAPPAAGAQNAPTLPVQGEGPQTSSTQTPSATATSVIGKRERLSDSQPPSAAGQPQAKKERLDQSSRPGSPAKGPDAASSVPSQTQQQTSSAAAAPAAQASPKNASSNPSSRAPTPRILANLSQPNTNSPATLSTNATVSASSLPNSNQVPPPFSAPASSNTFPQNTQVPAGPYSATTPQHLQQHLQQQQLLLQQQQQAVNAGSPQSAYPPAQPQTYMGVPARAPSAASAHSPMGPPPQPSMHNSPFRQPSLPPSTPQQTSAFQRQQQQMQSSQHGQPSNAPTPAQMAGSPPGATQQQPPPGGPPQQSGRPQMSLDVLAQDMMRLQSMVQQARYIQNSPEIFSKLPNEAKASLMNRIQEQEAQLEQLKRIYEQYHKAGNAQLQVQTPTNMQASNAQTSMPQQTQFGGASAMASQGSSQGNVSGHLGGPGRPPQEGQRQSSATHVQQPGSAASPSMSHASPAPSMHQSPMSAHLSRPPTRQAMLASQPTPGSANYQQSGPPNSAGPGQPTFNPTTANTAQSGGDFNQHQRMFMEQQRRFSAMQQHQQQQQGGPIAGSPMQATHSQQQQTQQPVMGPPMAPRPGQPMPQYPGQGPAAAMPPPRPPSVLRQAGGPGLNPSTPQSGGPQQMRPGSVNSGYNNVATPLNPSSGQAAGNSSMSSPAASVASLSGSVQGNNTSMPNTASGAGPFNSAPSPAPSQMSNFGSPAPSHLQPPGSANPGAMSGVSQAGQPFVGQSGLPNGNLNILQQRSRMAMQQGQSGQATQTSGPPTQTTPPGSQHIPYATPAQAQAAAVQAAQRQMQMQMIQQQQQQQEGQQQGQNSPMSSRGSIPPPQMPQSQGSNPNAFPTQHAMQGLPPNFQMSGDASQQQQQILKYQQFLQAQRMQQMQQQPDARAGSPGGVNAGPNAGSPQPGMAQMMQNMTPGLNRPLSEQEMRIVMQQQARIRQQQAMVAQQQQQQGSAANTGSPGAGQQQQGNDLSKQLPPNPGQQSLTPEQQMQFQQMQMRMALARQQQQQQQQGGVQQSMQSGGPGGMRMSGPGMPYQQQQQSPFYQAQTVPGPQAGFNPAQLQAMQNHQQQTSPFPYNQMPGPQQQQQSAFASQAQMQPQAVGQGLLQPQPPRADQQGNSNPANNTSAGLDFDSYINV